MGKRRAARQAKALPDEQELRMTRLGWWLLGLLPGLFVAWLVHQFHGEQQEQLQARIEALRSAQAGLESTAPDTEDAAARLTGGPVEDRPRFEFYQLLTETRLSSEQADDDRPTPERAELAQMDRPSEDDAPADTGTAIAAGPNPSDEPSTEAAASIATAPGEPASPEPPPRISSGPSSADGPIQTGSRPEQTGQVDAPPAADVNASAAGNVGRYLIQAGTFREERHADTLRARLALLGLSAQTETLAGNGTLARHRVRVGPIDGRQEANRLMARLRDNEINAILLRLEN